MCGKGAPFAGPSSRDLVGCCHLVGVAAGCSGCCWGAACAALPLFAAEDISCYKGLEDLDRVVGHEESAVLCRMNSRVKGLTACLHMGLARLRFWNSMSKDFKDC